jgi:hypothetical protein
MSDRFDESYWREASGYRKFGDHPELADHFAVADTENSLVSKTPPSSLPRSRSSSASRIESPRFP